MTSSSPGHVQVNRRPTLVAPSTSVSAHTSTSMTSIPQPTSSNLSLESSSPSPSVPRTDTSHFTSYSRERSRSGGPNELISVKEVVPIRGTKSEPLAQGAELDFADFVALYKAFSLRARKDLREVFRGLAVTRKSLSDSSLDDHTSPSSPPTPPYTKLGANSVQPFNAYQSHPQPKSVGLLTRNTSLDLLVFRNNCQKKKIFDAIAAASILINCAGVDTSKCQVVTIPDLRKFLQEEQGERLSDEMIEELMERHEPDPLLRAQGYLSFEGFARLLMDEDNYAFRDELVAPPEDDMMYPLSHYYIASSHNTYLTGHQLKGESSVELYSQVKKIKFLFIEKEINRLI